MIVSWRARGGPIVAERADAVSRVGDGIDARFSA
jgi:hypothetical protein